MKLVLQTGFPIERFRKRLEDADLTNEESKTQLIKELHQQWMEKIELRRAQIEAGTIAPKKKKPASKIVHDPKWAEAKRICRLNAEDIRKAKELGISPRSLIKNVPSPSQKWKAPSRSGFISYTKSGSPHATCLQKSLLQSTATAQKVPHPIG